MENTYSLIRSRTSSIYICCTRLRSGRPAGRSLVRFTSSFGAGVGVAGAFAGFAAPVEIVDDRRLGGGCCCGVGVGARPAGLPPPRSMGTNVGSVARTAFSSCRYASLLPCTSLLYTAEPSTWRSSSEQNFVTLLSTNGIASTVVTGGRVPSSSVQRAYCEATPSVRRGRLEDERVP